VADGPALALQKALVAHLRADAPLVALVGARVYDEPPPAVTFPYVRLGGLDASALRMDCFTDTDITFAVEVHSRSVAGKVEATRVAEAVRYALDDASLSATGFTVDWCQWLTQAVTRAPDGQSHIATVAFEASLAAA
jgi:hypothetical protein